MLDRLTGTLYVTPLREGGSLPAVVETDGGPFVVKFKGAGQGAKALVAEHLAAGLALALDLPVPRPAVVSLAEGFGRAEPDPEIQDILRGSAGPNFGLAYLPGALPFDPAAGDAVAPDLAAAIVWFDALITNVDRTVRNTNLLLWRGRLWLIDHGASLYFHHRPGGWQERAAQPFPQIKDHVLLHRAGDLAAADRRLRPRLNGATLRAIVDDVPAEWLGDGEQAEAVAALRAAYIEYLTRRLTEPRAWVAEAIVAQQRGPVRLERRTTHRVD